MNDKNTLLNLLPDNASQFCLLLNLTIRGRVGCTRDSVGIMSHNISVTSIKRRIQNLYKYLRWSVFGKRSILDVWQGSEYASEYEVVWLLR